MHGGGDARVSQDVLPYTIVEGHRRNASVNSIGMQRRGFSEEDLKACACAIKSSSSIKS
nr:hypothetical protein [Akkermansia muciniphila]